MRIRRMLGLTVLAAVLMAAAGWYVLITPGNPLTRLFQRSISDVEARIIVGPFPEEADFRLLKQHQVSLIVTLLNPGIPYEATLLEREKVMAATFGLELRSFPMSSILGQRFGDDYDRSAAAAAEAIAAHNGKVYLHCYLGIHRIQVVRDLLAAKGIDAGTYAVRTGERAEADRLLDLAEAHYNAGRYPEALEGLAKIDAADLTDAARMLRGWSFYRTGDTAKARDSFAELQRVNPGNADASIGLGYCAYRDADYAAAEKHFTSAIKALPGNADALGGLGLTLYREGRLGDAARHLEAALKIAPTNQELRDALVRIQGGSPGSSR